MASELEETKQSLEKAREESDHMARYLSSLQQELELTKRELQRFKTSNFGREEDLKHEDQPRLQFHKKKCVTFANPPLVAQVAVPPPPQQQPPQAVLLRHPSLKKKKKKALIPFIGGIFSKKKGTSEVSYA